jgi:photosystem II stability/assembly factor-like uncharacterized protein
MRAWSLALVAGLLALVAVPTPGQQSAGVVTSLTLFAGTAEGLWRSTNWGGSWERVRGNPSGVYLDALGAARAILPIGPLVYVGGDGGLYLSTDFGETWAPLSLTRGIQSLLTSHWPNADATVFAGTRDGLLRSRDGGRTFASTALAAAVNRLDWPGPALVVASARGLLVTTDEGERLAGPGRGLPDGEVRAMALSSYFAVDPVLFAAPASGGVFRSSDGGVSWLPAGLAGERVGDLVWLGPFLYAAGEGGVYRSEDTGNTWTRIADSPGRPTRLMFPLAPAAGLEAFLATDRGVFRTADGGRHWSVSGFEGHEVFTIATFPAPEPARDRKRRR